MLVLAAAIFVVSFSKRSINRSSLWLRPAQFAYSRTMNRVGKCEATTVLETCGRSRVSVDMPGLSNVTGAKIRCCLRGETAQRLVWSGADGKHCARQLHPALTPGYAPAPTGCPSCVASATDIRRQMVSGAKEIFEWRNRHQEESSSLDIGQAGTYSGLKCEKRLIVFLMSIGRRI